MSPLTKLFVVLLVILALLNAAGEVVFVNKVLPLQPMLEIAQNKLKEATDLQGAEHARMQDMESQRNDAISAHEKYVSDTTALLNATRGQVNSDQVMMTALKKKADEEQSTIDTLTAANLTAVTQAGEIQKENENLNKTNNARLARMEEDARRITDLQAQVETLAENDENLDEQLKDSKDMVAKLERGLAKFGPDAVGNAIASLGDIRGLVTDVQVLHDNTYVTVNVGGADGITPNSHLEIVDGQNFLGELTIEKVDSKDAQGRVDGPPDKISKIHPGVEVLSKLRS